MSDESIWILTGWVGREAAVCPHHLSLCILHSPQPVGPRVPLHSHGEGANQNRLLSLSLISSQSDSQHPSTHKAHVIARFSIAHGTQTCSLKLPRTAACFRNPNATSWFILWLKHLHTSGSVKPHHLRRGPWSALPPFLPWPFKLQVPALPLPSHLSPLHPCTILPLREWQWVLYMAWCWSPF